MLLWTPQSGARRVGRPRRRWEDSLNEFVREMLQLPGGAWVELAQDRDGWKAWEDAYAAAGE